MYSYRNICQLFFAYLQKKIEIFFNGVSTENFISDFFAGLMWKKYYLSGRDGNITGCLNDEINIGQSPSILDQKHIDIKNMNDYFYRGMSTKEERSRQKRCFLVRRENFFDFHVEVIRARAT